MTHTLCWILLLAITILPSLAAIGALLSGKSVSPLFLLFACLPILCVVMLFRGCEEEREMRRIEASGNVPSDRSWMKVECRECHQSKYGEACREHHRGEPSAVPICDDCYVQHMLKAHGMTVAAPQKKRWIDGHWR